MTILTPKQRWLGTISGLAISLILASASFAQDADTDTDNQNIISDAQTSAIQSDGLDTALEGTGSITLEDAGPAFILNSDNILANDGTITINDVDNATGVELQSGPSRSFINRGNITLTEDFTPEDSDEDGIADGAFAEGTGRTGILISGASPFEGNIDLASTSAISIEGNDSFGINLSNTVMAQEGLTGNLSNAGNIVVIGDNATGINVASVINGDFTNSGTVQTQGINAQGINIDADIQGGFVNAGGVATTGFRTSTRPPLAVRELLAAEDLLLGGSAININADIDNGILLGQAFADVFDAEGSLQTDEDGNALQAVTSTSTITQFGSAPAVNIDGEGTPITIGQVAQITDPEDEDFDANQQFSFVNEGSITAQGVFDDFDAVGLQTADANFTAGINNSGTINVTAFRAPAEVTDVDDVNITPDDGIARAVALGSGTITPSFTNSGVLSATADEPDDLIFADRDNILAGRDVIATTVDIEAGANVPEFTNAGTIVALVTAREGTATAILDSSDTLRSFTNTGVIAVGAATSDPLGEAETDLNAVALDFSQSTGNITLLQERAEDTNLDDDLIPADPMVTGDILLGSGDDDFTVTAGEVLSDLDFGGGSDSFALSGGSAFEGTVENAAGLSLEVSDNSSLTLSNTAPVNIADAVFEDTGIYRPLLNNADGSATLLNASGDITFAAGSTISPVLGGIEGIEDTNFAIAQAGGALTVDDLAGLSDTASSFLLNSNFSLDESTDTLFVTFDLREPGVAIADGGLGLDDAQTLAFDTVIEALTNDSALGAAFGNINDGAEFNSAYNQLLPEFSVASRQFILSSVDGAVGAVGNHLDSVRRSPEKGGGIWLQQYAYFADRELANSSEQFRGSGFGFTTGIDRAFGNFHAIGANIGFSSTEIEDVLGVDEPLDVTTVQAGLYAGWATGRLGIEAYGGAGFSTFEQNRNVQVNAFNGTARGDWDGTHINGSLRAGYDVDLSEKFWVRPAMSLDYLRLSEDGFTETGDAGITLAVDDRTSETASATGLINFGAKFQGKRTWIRPSLRAGIRHEFINDPVSTSFRFANLVDSTGTSIDSNTATIESAVFSDTGIVLGFSVAAGSVFSSIGFDFDSDIRDGLIRHTGRVVIRLLF